MMFHFDSNFFPNLILGENDHKISLYFSYTWNLKSIGLEIHQKTLNTHFFCSRCCHFK